MINKNKLVAVAGTVRGSINGVSIYGKVTGTGDRETGSIKNIFHGVDSEIGTELSQIVIGLTIVCMEIGKEGGAAKNLSSMAPNQRLKRIATYKSGTHTMQCKQSVEWPTPDIAVVDIEYSGSLPSFSKEEGYRIPNVVCDFRQTGANTFEQKGRTTILNGTEEEELSIDIQCSIEGAKLKWSKVKMQYLENAENTSVYDEKNQEITYKTNVTMLEKQ